MEGRLSVGEAACLLHVSERQVQRAKRSYRSDFIAWVQYGPKNAGRLRKMQTLDHHLTSNAHVFRKFFRKAVKS